DSRPPTPAPKRPYDKPTRSYRKLKQQPKLMKMTGGAVTGIIIRITVSAIESTIKAITAIKACIASTITTTGGILISTDIKSTNGIPLNTGTITSTAQKENTIIVTIAPTASEATIP
ncbi:MAG: hypothetical protein GWO38_23495, partial [Phycisphaerae bacterium]|nr:hypothetical protein [Phycisphaerae bacterium]NIX30520.1 hypothetical protein [Phycisphaerae bacterium]